MPVDNTHIDGRPLIGLDAQRTLLRQGTALAREVGRLAGELATPIPLRCIIATGDTNGTFRFHRIRPRKAGWPMTSTATSEARRSAATSRSYPPARKN